MPSDFLNALEKAIDEIKLPEGTELYWRYDFDLCLYCFRIEKLWCYKKFWIWPWTEFDHQLIPIEDLVRDIKHEINKGIIIKFGI